MHQNPFACKGGLTQMLSGASKCYLKHEGEAVSRQALWLVAVLCGAALKSVSVWTMWRHTHMQACTCTAASSSAPRHKGSLYQIMTSTSCCVCQMLKRTSRQEAVLLSLILAADEAHELRHDIAMEIGRAEAVLCHCPTRREYNKICRDCSCVHQFVSVSVTST